jgi:hypothetical protein
MGAVHFWIMGKKPITGNTKYLAICGFNMGPWGYGYYDKKDVPKVTCQKCHTAINKRLRNKTGQWRKP